MCAFLMDACEHVSCDFSKPPQGLALWKRQAPQALGGGCCPPPPGAHYVSSPLSRGQPIECRPRLCRARRANPARGSRWWARSPRSTAPPSTRGVPRMRCGCSYPFWVDIGRMPMRSLVFLARAGVLRWLYDTNAAADGAADGGKGRRARCEAPRHIKRFVC